MSDMSQTSELATLKERATLLGIRFSPNISVEVLREKINNKLSNTSETEATVKTPSKVDVEKAKKISDNAEKKRMLNSMKALVRCIIACNNPNKKEYTGDIFTGGNSTEMITKYIPFNKEWEIPQVLLNIIKEKKCQVFYSTKEKGVAVTRPRLINEYTVTILPQLTPKELEDLKIQQAMNNSIDK